MKNTLCIALSCATLGFALSASGGEGVGIRFIEHPDPMYAVGFWLSDDGSTLVGSTWGLVPSLIVDRGTGWETILESTSNSALAFSSGVSDNGRVIAVDTLGPVGPAIWRDGSVEHLPNIMIDGEHAFLTRLGVVSGDGSVIGVTAYEDSQNYAYVYQNGQYTDLGFDPGRRTGSLTIDGIDRTGSSLAITENLSGRYDEDPSLAGARAWLWQGGEYTEIPDLVLTGDRVDSHAHGMSSDGSTVFGTSTGLFLDDRGLTTDRGPVQSWIYRDGIQTSLNDGRFDFVLAADITDDGQEVLVHAGDDEAADAYIWSQSNGFVAVIDLLEEAGIDLGGQLVNFQQLSGDGSVLSGTIYKEGYGFTSVIVTIPSPGAFLMLGGGLLMFTGRRR